MSSNFDVIIIGGGIIGAGCALEASAVGLRTLLLEKSDFGSETTAGSFKIIHGGLRYIQHLDYPRLKESVNEQRFIRQAAPNLIKPLPFLVPCYGLGMKSKLALSTACTLYESLTKRRNDNVPDALKLPGHKKLTKEEVLKIAPLLSQKKLSGGIVFYDCQMVSPERLMISIIRKIEDNGGIVKNYSEVTGIKTRLENKTLKIDAVKIRDLTTNLNYSVKGKFVINALGPTANLIGNLFDQQEEPIKTSSQILSKGIQLVLPEIIKDYALSIEGSGEDSASMIKRGGRSFFLQPWEGLTLAGTTDSIEKDSSDFKITMTEIKKFIEELYQAYPSNLLKPAYVQYAFGGLRPVDSKVKAMVEKGVDRDDMVNTSRDEEIIDHSKQKWSGLPRIENLISVVGIKYTTFRSVGERAIKLLNNREFEGKEFKFKSGGSKNTRLFDSSSNFSLEEMMQICLDSNFQINSSELKVLDTIYGSTSLYLLNKSIENSRKYSLSPNDSLLFSKVEYSIKFEHAKKLADIVIRRVLISHLGYPGHELLEKISKFASIHLGWNEDKRNSEIVDVRTIFTFSD